ncbi:MAG TPA: 2-amino-4-hydroxy-6-hydroxymethyldihydropteridine diphosphokinase [Spirochaetota bacterium]|nr:2-amino-4-hydroxy-6-hydroxymethyldihydropteridine diphosphokinase [Spirochaetota bacterium]
MAAVYIGLGSNLGSREHFLSSARKRIAESAGDVIAESTVLETKAVDFTQQPDFLNQVVKIETDLDPMQLLETLKRIETEIGRSKTFHKGPREIDLDILLYNGMVLSSDRLVIPHPAIVHRDFVMQHLVELDPELRDPVTGMKYRDL